MEFVQTPDLNVKIKNEYMKEEHLSTSDNEEDVKESLEQIFTIPQDIICSMDFQDRNSLPCKDPSSIKEEFHEDTNMYNTNTNIQHNCISQTTHNMASLSDSSSSNSGNNELVKFQINISAIQTISKDNQITIGHDGPLQCGLLFVSTDLDCNNKPGSDGGDEQLTQDPLSFSPKPENEVIYNLTVKKVEEVEHNTEGVISNAVSSNQQQTLHKCVYNNCESDRRKLRDAQSSNLITEQRIYTNDKPYTCNQCSYRSTRRSSLVTHKRTHTNEKPFACNQCLYRATTNSQLLRHMRNHTNDKPFACNQCPFRAPQSSDLVKHIRTHTNEKPFACSQCSYRSVQRSNLITHMKTHTKEKRFACSQCSYRSIQRCNLVTHTRTHTNEKPFACSQCSYRCAQHSTLVTHMRTHRNEKHFVCSHCSYRSKQRSNLITHMRTHTKEKRFACSQCSYRSIQRCNLVTHTRTHTREKPFACSQCSYRCVQRSSLVTHMRTHRNEKHVAFS